MSGLSTARSVLRTLGRSYATAHNASQPYVFHTSTVCEVAEIQLVLQVLLACSLLKIEAHELLLAVVMMNMGGPSTVSIVQFRIQRSSHRMYRFPKFTTSSKTSS